MADNDKPPGFDDYVDSLPKPDEESLDASDPQSSMATKGWQTLGQAVKPSLEQAWANRMTPEKFNTMTSNATNLKDPEAFQQGQQQLAESSLGTAMGSMHEPVDPKSFYKTLSGAQETSPNIANAVHLYKPNEYAGMKTYLSADQKSGYAVKPDGDLVSVFSTEPGRGNQIVSEAKDNGATKLDAFDVGPLKELYGRHGFEEYKREPNWTGKGPDVFYAKLPEEVAAGTEPAPMYSKLQQTIQQKMGGSATPEQINGMLSGIKGEERQYSGLDDFLQGKDKVSKADLLAHVQANEPQINKIVKSGPTRDNPDTGEILNESPKFSNYALPGGENYKENLYQLPEVSGQ